MGVFDFLNPLSNAFNKGNQEKKERLDQQSIGQSYGVGDQTDDIEKILEHQRQLGMNGMPSAQIGLNYINFDALFGNKTSKVSFYRSMLFYPHVNKAINIVCDEAISKDAAGNICIFGVKETVAAKNKITKEEIQVLADEFDYIINTVFTKEQIWPLFKKWLCDSELCLEIKQDKNDSKVIGVKTLNPMVTFPVYDDNVIIGYKQIPAMDYQTNTTTTEKSFKKNQIAYSNYGTFGINKQDIRGYLHSAIRPYNMLKSAEDMLAVYRLTRAPMKRIFNVEVGRMQTGAAEAYLNQAKNQYRKRLNFDSETGSMIQGKNTHTMNEDFWFPKREGQGTTVETLEGNSTFLAQLEDINMFVDSLYTALLIPRSRYSDPTATYQSGKDLAKEEFNFNKFVGRLQNQFKSVIIDVYMQHLRIRGYQRKYIDKSLFEINLVKSTYFEEFKNFEMNEKRIAMYDNLKDFIVTAEKPDAEFSYEFVMKNVLMFNDQDYRENERMKMNERLEFKKLKEASKTSGTDQQQDNTSNPQDMFGGSEIPSEQAPSVQSTEEQPSVPQEAPSEPKPDTSAEDLLDFNK